MCVLLALAFSYFIILINNQKILQLGFLKHLIPLGHALVKDLTKLLTKYDLKKISDIRPTLVFTLILLWVLIHPRPRVFVNLETS